MSKLFKVFAVIIIIMLGLAIWFGIEWLHFLDTPLVPENKPAVDFILADGSSVKSLAADLHNKGVLEKPRLFSLLVRLRGETRSLQTGEYRIEPGTLPVQLVNKLVYGQVILYSFTIVDGWTFSKILAELAKNPRIEHILAGVSDAEIMQKIGHSGEIPEGRFFPDTYKFSTNTKDIAILSTAYNLMQAKLNEAWANRSQDAPYDCPYKALIAASIIEKEAALSEERPIISGIIARRMQKNMYLQLDPTVIYGLGAKFTGKLTTEDLKKDTPFNTYVNKGLPPTPICMPSEDAVWAALHPKAGDVLYFVAKGDGSHEFSATLKKHDAAIKKYQLKK
jgi:UPF0755 protein